MLSVVAIILGESENKDENGIGGSHLSNKKSNQICFADFEALPAAASTAFVQLRRNVSGRAHTIHHLHTPDHSR